MIGRRVAAGYRSGRRRAPAGAARIVLLLLLLLPACDPEVSLVVPRPADGEPTLRLTLLLEDSLLAAQLGWEEGVPAARVWIQQEQVPGVQELRSDSLGIVELANLPGSRFWIWAERQLSATERARIGGAEVRVLGGATKLNVTAFQLDEATLWLGTEEPGSLVISELATNYLGLAGGAAYFGSSFLEVANNADTTVFLGGVLLGAGFIFPGNSPNWPCPVYDQFRTDPGAVYASWVLRFPGAPGEYPLAPGQTAVVAAQAIDHREIHLGRGLLDLRGADFELPGRVDNPQVPNMIDVGLYGPTGGWERWFDLHAAPFLARPADVGSLERVLDVHDRYRIRFPRELLLDLATFVHPIMLYSPLNPFCPQMLPPDLDRLEGIFGRHPDPEAHRSSIQRKRVPGTERLQRTRTSMLDFFYGPVSPRELP